MTPGNDYPLPMMYHSAHYFVERGYCRYCGARGVDGTHIGECEVEALRKFHRAWAAPGTGKDDPASKPACGPYIGDLPATAQAWPLAWLVMWAVNAERREAIEAAPESARNRGGGNGCGLVDIDSDGSWAAAVKVYEGDSK